MDAQQSILQKVTRVIKQNGIPAYLKKWHPPKMKKKYPSKRAFYHALEKYVRSYHVHSFIYVQRKTKATKEKAEKKLPIFHFDGKIGRITYYHYYPSFNDKYTRDPIYKKYVTRVRKKLKEWKQKGIQGLIIDLRQHKGGWFQPCLASLSPVLNNNSLFAWSNKRIKKTEKKWLNLQGERIVGNSRFRNKINLFCPIAVLIGKRTVSSGEFCAAAFYRNNKEIKTFGQTTKGKLSSNATIPISKGVELVLTSQLVTTVDGKFHKDEKLYPEARTKKPITAARNWFKSI